MSPSIEHALATHAAALRSLARDLVGADAADDVLQDTALQALQQPPRRDGELRGWLARIVQRLAMRHRRAAHRRSRHESGIEQPLPQRGPGDEIEHRDTIRHVTDAVLALPEIYQRALLLRYFEELTPTAIAERTGESLGTVKSRLARGLQLLRERLDVGNKEYDWRASLGAFLGLRGSGAATATGVMLMGTGVKLCLGGIAAVVAVAAIVWLQRPPPAPPAWPGSGAGVVAAIASDGGGADNLRSVAPSVADASGAAVPAAAAVTLHGRCVDEDGRAIAGVVARAGSGYWRIGTPAPIDVVTTTADGVFTFALTPPLPDSLSLQFEAADRCRCAGVFRDLAAGQDIDLGDVQLPLGAPLCGRVIDEHGIPQPGARLGGSVDTRTETAIAPIHSFDVTAAADGSFATELPLPRGTGTLGVGNRRLVHGPSLPIATPSAPIDVVVFDLPPLVGTVVDEDGVAIGGANLGAGNSTTQTDSAGHFEFHCGQPDTGSAPLQLRGGAKGFEPGSFGPFLLGARDLRLVLRHIPELLIRVRDAETGGPVRAFAVAVPPWGVQLEQRQWPEGVGHLSTTGSAICVDPGDESLAPSTIVPVPPRGDGRTIAIDIALQPRRTRQLLLSDAAGAPVAGVAVELIDADGQPLDFDTDVRPFAAWQRAFGPLLLQQGTTDADGALALRGPDHRDLALRLHAPGVASKMLPVRFDRQEPLRVDIERGASWSGRLLPESVVRQLLQPKPWVNQPDQGVSETVQTGPDTHAAAHATGLALQLRSGTGQRLSGCAGSLFPCAADGSFHIDGIPSGRWQVFLSVDDDLHHTADLDFAPGESLQRDLDIDGFRRVDVELQLFVDGSPAAGSDISVQQLCGADLTPCRVARRIKCDTDGRLRMPVFAGELACTLYMSDERRLMTEQIAVPAGHGLHHVFDLHTGELSLHLVDADGKPAAHVLLMLKRDLLHRVTSDWSGSTDESGNVAVRGLMHGPAVVSARPGKGSYVDLGSIQVPIGPAATPIELRLPPHQDR